MNFSEQAANWDSERRISRAKEIAEEIIKAAKPKPTQTALEFGCGTGLISFNLSCYLREITCVDTAEGMILSLQEKIAENNIKNIKPLLVDLIAQEIGQNEYDLIYTSMALHHIIDTQVLLQRLYRLLKPKGTICIVDLNEEDGRFHQSEKDFQGHNGFKQSQLKSVLNEIGYTEIASHTFYKGQKCVAGEMLDYSLFIMTGKK